MKTTFTDWIRQYAQSHDVLLHCDPLSTEEPAEIQLTVHIPNQPQSHARFLLRQSRILPLDPSPQQGTATTQLRTFASQTAQHAWIAEHLTHLHLGHWAWTFAPTCPQGHPVAHLAPAFPPFCPSCWNHAHPLLSRATDAQWADPTWHAEWRIPRRPRNFHDPLVFTTSLNAWQSHYGHTLTRTDTHWCLDDTDWAPATFTEAPWQLWMLGLERDVSAQSPQPRPNAPTAPLVPRTIPIAQHATVQTS